jgi:hypothetical protein
MDLDVWREPRTVVGNHATKGTLFLKGDDQEAWKDAYNKSMDGGLRLLVTVGEGAGCHGPEQ